MICFDLEKAFLQIGLPLLDQDRLCFLWYRNVKEGDFSVVGYRNKRLPFGLRCSPSILMLTLYYILIVDKCEGDTVRMNNLKHSQYDLIYMDNGAVTADSTDDILLAFHQLRDVFITYKFNIQQIVSNDSEVQGVVDKSLSGPAPVDYKLLGLNWNRVADTLSCRNG